MLFSLDPTWEKLENNRQSDLTVIRIRQTRPLLRWACTKGYQCQPVHLATGTGRGSPGKENLNLLALEALQHRCSCPCSCPAASRTLHRFLNTSLPGLARVKHSQTCLSLTGQFCFYFSSFFITQQPTNFLGRKRKPQ